MSLEGETFDIEKAKAEIKLLVEKYEREKSNNKLDSYSEEQTKNDFILRLFKALGWDVYNAHSNTLTAEEKASRGRVDYGFRINDIPKFFLEAKSFRAGVDKDEYAFQSINYSWLKGCTWAVLTNFEKLIIFNAEWKEKLAVNCLFISLNYSDFLTNFDQLYLLSREAFVKNLLDKEAEKWHKKIKKTPIDKQLLQDLTKFREILTQGIMRRNESLKLTEEELDEVVQKILDRIIFIRTVEDRQIEPPHLRPLIREDHKGNLWKKVAELYLYFDDTYDSNLFTPDKCEKVVIGDQELETIIRGLHETEDGSVQYDFGAINVDVLGNVYEQYLGHILKKTKKSAIIQDGKGKRKEHGIYYTPTYVVDYIVQNTVGSKIAEMGIDWKTIRILDPACGSGSFLIKAFDYLTLQDKELERKEELKKDLYGTHIATERFGYLKNNIFGVDLDTKAVEIAQLNLMIRATERKERLPSLQQNIKNGNSLIDDSTIVGEKAFKWEVEFAEIIKNGGFDIIIGNPPYGYRGIPTEEIKNAYSERYVTAEGNFDMYRFFIERTITLLKEGGLLGFIIPNTFLSAPSYKKLRRFILDNCTVKLIADLGLGVFENVVVESIIMILQKNRNTVKNDAKVTVSICRTRGVPLSNPTKQYTIQQKQFFESKDNVFNIYLNNEIDSIAENMEKDSTPLAQISYTTVGINTGYIKKILTSPTKIDDRYHKMLSGKDIGRYFLRWRGGWIMYDKNIVDSYGDKGRSLPAERIFTEDKILVQRTRRGMARKLICTLDTEQYYNLNRLSNIVIEDKSYPIKYCLGILNSNLMDFYFQKKFNEYEVKPTHLRQLPIKKGSLSEQEQIIELVERMLDLSLKISNIDDRRIEEKVKLEEEIKKTDEEIDEIVYRIYGVGENEKKIIKNSME